MNQNQKFKFCFNRKIFFNYKQKPMKQLLKKVLFVAIGFGLIVPVLNATSIPTSTEPVAIDLTTPVTPSAVHNAIANLKSLSRAERKSKVREVRKAVKEYKRENKAGAAGSTNTLLLVILAILIPPLAVYLHQGEINKKFWISLLLTLLFILPGIIYSIIVVTGND